MRVVPALRLLLGLRLRLPFSSSPPHTIHVIQMSSGSVTDHARALRAQGKQNALPGFGSLVR